MKILKIFKIIVSAALIMLLFTGCESRKNLNDLSVVEGLGIDYEDDKISVTVQSLNLAKEGNGADALAGNVTMNTQGKGDNISSAVDEVSESLSKKLFFGQNRILVFGMNMAKDYLNVSLDYLLRSADSRPDVVLCIAEEEAAKVMDSKENDALVPAQAISALLETGEENGFAVYVTANDLLNMYTDKTSDMYLPVIKPAEQNATVSGIAIYSDEKLVDVLSNDKTMGFLFLKNEINSGSLTINSDDFGKIGVDIISASTKTKARLENGQVIYDVKIKAYLMLDEIEKGIVNSISKKDIENITAVAEEEIKKQCSAAFYSCTENQSDCLRIGESLAKNSNKAYQSVCNDWDTHLKNTRLDIKVDCVIKKINENSNGY